MNYHPPDSELPSLPHTLTASPAVIKHIWALTCTATAVAIAAAEAPSDRDHNVIGRPIATQSVRSQLGQSAPTPSLSGGGAGPIRTHHQFAQ